MNKPVKLKFAFQEKEDLKLKSQGGDVQSLQNILASLGFLRGSHSLKEICKCTERAIHRYQRFYGLKADGIVGPKTKGLLEQPRCGVPDIPSNRSSGATASSPYVLGGCKYNKQHLTYAFLNGTGDLAGNRDQEIVRTAFNTWSKVANLRFEEVQSTDHPDFRIAWRTGNHGDGNSFDGSGNVLAHAFFPPPCGGTNAGDLHFDEAEQWIEDPDPSANGFLLLQVAIHEIGHLLGLRHSEDPSAIMYAYYGSDRTTFAQDDINGIQALYGAPSEVTTLQLSAEVDGSLDHATSESHYEIEIPGHLAVSIDGPADADFDLYIRKDAPPTTSDWDYRAFTNSADEELLIPVTTGDKYFVMARSYEGSGNFKLNVRHTA